MKNLCPTCGQEVKDKKFKPPICGKCLGTGYFAQLPPEPCDRCKGAGVVMPDQRPTT